MVIKEQQEGPGALGGYSLGILLLALSLAVFGLVVQYSAGISLSSTNRTGAFFRQLAYVPIAMLAGYALFRLDLDRIRAWRWWILGGACLMMLLARIPNIGVSVNGSWRWIDFGLFRLQASDLGKLALVIVLADFLARMQRHTLPNRFPLFQLSAREPYVFSRRGWIDFKLGFAQPLGVLLLIAGFIGLGPDLGTIILCCLVGGTMMLISGVRWAYVVPAALLGLTAFAVLIFNWPNRMRRFTSFLDPWEKRGDEAYQLFEGMVAFGVGGLTGKGAANGIQGRAYLPEAHTDFVFSVIGEEYGLIATTLVALVYLGIFWCAYRAMRSSADLYRFNVCLGATLFLVLQALINMGVVTGLLPTKGISLPFISYGGTNLVIMGCMVGLILNCIRESAQPAFAAKEARA
ncbi:MAG: cell cycle protein [Opitutia bacterium]|nr:MAG: cell cycle protein [Opitutae bacterium]